MNFDPLFLSRVQFAFTVSYHILFPSITIGLAVWNAFLLGSYVITGKEKYNNLFNLWRKIFAVLFGMGVVGGLVMAFQFGTNWSILSAKTGPVMGTLLNYETFTAFALEATFLGVVLYGQERVSRRFYFFSTVMIALGAVISSFWIVCNNTWMQYPAASSLINGTIIPHDWAAIVLNPFVFIRWIHMLLASFLTTAMCLLAAGAYYLLKKVHREEAGVMMSWGIRLTIGLTMLQLVTGDISGKYVYRLQPVKFAAIEARWHPEQPGREVWFAVPDVKNKRNLFELGTHSLGSWFATGSWTDPVSGLSDFPEKDWPPILITFFTFRTMVGLDLLMLAVSLYGLWVKVKGKLETTRWFLWCVLFAFPGGFLGVIAGWFTAETGRQPWAVYGLLRTADSMTPSLTVPDVFFTFTAYVLIDTVVLLFGSYYVFNMIREGP